MYSRAVRIRLAIVVVALLSSVSLAGSANEMFNRALEFWAYRDETRSLNKAISLFEAVLVMRPDFELERKTRLLLSRAYYWRGNSLDERDKDARKEAYSKGMDVLKPLLEKDPQDHEANFWYVVNLCSLGREVGVVKSAMHLPEILRRMKIVEAKDRWYFYGGPNRLYARMIQKSPGFIRKAKGYDLRDAERILKENVERYPFLFMNRLFLAELYIDEGRIEDACRELEIIVSSPPGDDPAYAPNNRRDLRKARKLLSRLRADYPRRCEPTRRK